MPRIIRAGVRRRESGNLVYLATNAGVAYTDAPHGFLLPDPDWYASNDGLSGDGLDVFRLGLDPNSSDGTQLATGYLVAKNGVYKNTALPDGTWTCILDDTDAQALTGADGDGAIVHFTRELVLPANDADYIGVILRRSFSGGFPPQTMAYNYYAYSTDGGATWNCDTTYWWETAVNVLSGSNLGYGDGFQNMFAWPSHTAAGTVYLSINVGRWWSNPGGGAAPPGLFASADGGATWVLQGTLNASDWTYCIVNPYADASGTPYADDTVAWRSRYSWSMNLGQQQSVQRTTAFPGPYAPTAWTDKGDVTMVLSWLMDICKNNENAIYVLMNGAAGVFSTQDGAATWTGIQPVTGCKWQALASLPSNAKFCGAAGVEITGNTFRGVQLTLDGGATWGDREGDLDTALPGISAVRSLVVDWEKYA